jgi:hypothetical protein
MNDFISSLDTALPAVLYLEADRPDVPPTAAGMLRLAAGVIAELQRELRRRADDDPDLADSFTAADANAEQTIRDVVEARARIRAEKAEEVHAEARAARRRIALDAAIACAN